MNYARLFTRRSDGRYVASIQQGGKRKYFYDKDPEKLYYRLQELKNPAPVKFRTILDAWQEEHSSAVGDKTAESYVAPCRRIKEEFGDDPPNEVTAARIQAFISGLGKRGYARRTVQLHRDILNMTFQFAILRGFISSSPMGAVSIPHGLKTTKRTLPADDALEAVRAHTDAPFALFALLCLYCGLRRGEALALRYEDIDRKANVIHITKALEYPGNQPLVKTPKTATGVRDVSIPSVLRPLLPHGAGYLFPAADGGPLTKIGYRHAWTRYCKTIGHDLTAHQLRHGYATYLYEAGVPVLAAQKLLGHTNASTTMNVYTHLRERQEAQAAQLLDQYLDNTFDNTKRCKVVQNER